MTWTLTICKLAAALVHYSGHRDNSRIVRLASSLQFRGLSNMTKKDIVRTISEELGLTQLKTKEIVQKTFDGIIDVLVNDGRIELRNFGVFEVKKRAARKGRNPKTGDTVDVPEKFVVTFKAGREMEQRVNHVPSRQRCTGAGVKLQLRQKIQHFNRSRIGVFPL